MKRYISVVEEVRIQYVCHTSDEFDKMLEKENLTLQEWMDNSELPTIWEKLEPSYEQILDYINTDKYSLLDED